MSCLKITTSRVGGDVAAELKRPSSARVDCLLTAASGSNMEMTRATDLRVRFAKVCDIVNPDAYLEIQPEIIWLADWGAYNDVLSNTRWYID